MVLSGSRQGAVLTLDRAVVHVGRNHDVDLRFDPEVDLEVSGRHAMIGLSPLGFWIVRDLQSTNGTFLNGRRITGDSQLSPGDRISFGESGPELEFRAPGPVGAAASVAGPPTVATRVGLAGGATSPGAGAAYSAAGAAHSDAGAALPASGAVSANAGAVFSGGGGASSGTGAGFSAAGTAFPGAGAASSLPSAVPTPFAGRRPLILGSTLVLGVTIVAAAYALLGRNAALEGERALLQQRIDSLTTAAQAVASLENEVSALTDALRESREEVREASLRLEQAQQRGDPAQVSALRAQLDSVTTALGHRQAAASLDFGGIQRRNRPAVAMIFVEGPDGRVATGTAFAVRPDATLLTSRHVIAGEDGLQRPRRIAIQFSDSDQVWPARLLAVADDADLAVVKVDNILGNVPVVQAFNLRPDTLIAGGVVASIGFPVGRGLTAQATYERGGIVQPLLAAGIVSLVTPDRIEFQGYGSAGASGSPVFDANGSVIAVLFGGLRDSTHPTLLGVPASTATRLLESLPN